MKSTLRQGYSPDPDDLQLRVTAARELLRKGLRDRRILKLDDPKERDRYIETCIDTARLRRSSVEKHFRLRAKCILQGTELFCHNLKCRDASECLRCPVVLRR